MHESGFLTIKLSKTQKSQRLEFQAIRYQLEARVVVVLRRARDGLSSLVVSRKPANNGLSVPKERVPLLGSHQQARPGHICIHHHLSSEPEPLKSEP